jgi:histamine N-methyltransferase
MSPQKEFQPISLPLSAQGYADANEAFRRCWQADRPQVLAFLRQHLPPYANQAVGVLGIGVGDGEFDIQLIDFLSNELGVGGLHYSALEPNEAQLQGFRRRAEAVGISTTEIEYIQSTAEEFTPERSFDLIHFIHSLYHMPIQEERLILDAHRWLGDNGHVLISLSSEQGGIYQLMNRFWSRIDYSFFTSGLFGQESLLAVLERNKLSYRYELYPEVAIDVTACFDRESELGHNLLNFLLQADIRSAPSELYEDILVALDELAYNEGDKRLLSHPSGVFLISA